MYEEYDEIRKSERCVLLSQQVEVSDICSPLWETSVMLCKINKYSKHLHSRLSSPK
jgi:hypothetical protein